MKTKVYTALFNTAQNIKRGLGIKNYTAFKKKRKKKLLKLVYKKKYNADDLVYVMAEMGMKQCSIVFIHSSMTEFFNYTGTAEELIDKILSTIGSEGTLMMPAYLPAGHKYDNEVDFDVKNSPSGAGYLTEVFRKYPNVVRSINYQHSVCAYGKHAKEFTSEHHKSITAWDEYSPYYKMSQYDTFVFSFGLKNFLGSFIHCVESVLRTKYQYFNNFFDKEVIYKYRNENGVIRSHKYLTHVFARKFSKKKIMKFYFDEKEFHKYELSNLLITMINAKYTLNLFLYLANKGITMFSVPSTKGFLNKNGEFLKIQ